MKKVLLLALALIIMAGFVAGCGAKTATSDTAPTVRTIKIALPNNFKPITYSKEDGTLDGYDVAVMKAINELYPQYKFEFEVANKDVMNSGVQLGTYQIGINGMFKSESRLKTYLMPENNIGFLRVAFIIKEGTKPISSLDQVAKGVADGSIVLSPLNTAGGLIQILDEYNKANPQNKIQYTPTSEWARGTLYKEVLAGTYTAVFDLVDVANNTIASNKDYAGLKVSDTIALKQTYCIINKDETQLRADIDAGLEKLKANGTLSKISVQYFGTDIWAK